MSTPDDVRPNDVRATSIILEGGTPRDVARRYPVWFVLHFEGITRLWEMINYRSWRGNE